MSIELVSLLLQETRPMKKMDQISKVIWWIIGLVGLSQRPIYTGKILQVHGLLLLINLLGLLERPTYAT